MERKVIRCLTIHMAEIKFICNIEITNIIGNKPFKKGNVRILFLFITIDNDTLFN